ncbi:AI-2E family transporter [Altericroceibacterium xinjiangense]|uniref:AI-2E family transporter n=1 Tax=Altericroceibacterium xinjiangense TaxID=762261 RepID=UPI000F7E435A|nr:AI-2E family transporter [Altericroceibacterium xinjiangense]
MEKADLDGEKVGVSPTRIDNPRLRHEAQRAFVWASVIGLIALAVYMAQSLLVVFGGLVIAALIDGGARLLGRVLPIGRGWRIGIVVFAAFIFLAWVGWYAGSQMLQQAAMIPTIFEEQVANFTAWASSLGFATEASDLQALAGQFTSGVGTLTRLVTGMIGGFASLILIAILGIYIAAEPRLYERGVSWMVPAAERENLLVTLSRMGRALRHLLMGRLIGMVLEGLFTWALLAVYGVPMAALLGLLTGLLAFIPNIGALISGVIMIAVGFSGGTDMGLYAILVYFGVQTIDGYILVPFIAKKTVDLAPALVLAMQLIMGVLFGILGLALADPLIAMIKVALERRSEQRQSRIDHDGA